MVTSQANQNAAAASKNTICEQHTSAALRELGFAHYLCDLPPMPEESKRGSNGKGKNKRGAPSGLSEEEALRLQQEMFASAKRRMESANPGPEK